MFNPHMAPFLSDTTAPMPESFWVSLADRSISLAMACFVAWLFAKWYQGAMASRDKVQESKDGLYTQIIAQMTARLDAQEHRTSALEQEISECKRDRSDLRNRLDSIVRGESKIDTHSGTT